MAVYTKISSSFLIKILKDFQIGNLIDYSGIKEGIENTNYFLKTTEGKFILTIFEKRVEDNDIPFFIKLMKHLSKKQFLCPQPIKDKNNKFIQKINNKKFIIVTFLEGSWKKLPTVKRLGKIPTVTVRRIPTVSEKKKRHIFFVFCVGFCPSIANYGIGA